jgi:hypothetical protein
MTTNLMAAHNEYAKRPQDERFPSLDAMVAAALSDKQHSAERTYNLNDLRAVACTSPLSDGTPGTQDRVMLESPKGRAAFTHYSFGQLARTIGAPAAYLRTLPPTIAADAMNFGLTSQVAGTAANLLVRMPNGNGRTEPVIRAATSDTYGRVWDAELYGNLNRLFNASQGWTTPPTWTGEPAGVYRGDRDSFVILVNGGSIVTDPSISSRQIADAASQWANGGQNQGPTDGMYRGIMLRNSEVGHCSISIEGVLFRYICGNHIIWGAVMDRTFKRRHVGTRITRDTMRELSDFAWKYTSRSASQDEAIIRTLIDTEVAHTREAVIDELKKMGATKQQAEQAYATCERTEAASPRSFWGLAQGFTRNSQESGYQDDRLALDLFAAQLLRKGAKVAA